MTDWLEFSKLNSITLTDAVVAVVVSAVSVVCCRLSIFTEHVFSLRSVFCLILLALLASITLMLAQKVIIIHFSYFFFSFSMCLSTLSLTSSRLLCVICLPNYTSSSSSSTIGQRSRNKSTQRSGLRTERKSTKSLLHSHNTFGWWLFQDLNFSRRRWWNKWDTWKRWRPRRQLSKFYQLQLP